ncbi:MAG: DNA-directed RNA polymerase subunit alpha C-terminal domain-containing protein [Clostridiaceae bacterium]
MSLELRSIKISKPAFRALETAGITTLIQLCNFSEQELLALHGVGPKAIQILGELLVKEGLTFKKD